MREIKIAIKNSLIGDLNDPEIIEKWFMPIWIVRCGFTRYKVNKFIKGLLNSGYVKYVQLSGGCDENCKSIPPFNGYEVTEKGFGWLESEVE